MCNVYIQVILEDDVEVKRHEECSGGMRECGILYSTHEIEHGRTITFSQPLSCRIHLYTKQEEKITRPKVTPLMKNI